MDASKKSVMKKEEQELSPAANPSAAVMTAEADAIKEEQDKATVTAAAGRVAEEEMDMASGSGVAHLAPPAVASAAPRSPLSAAVSGLTDHVLERMVKVLMRKCHPPQELYPLIGKLPLRPPWWPTGREQWWPELGAGAVVPPYKPARLLSKAEKEVAVVAMVKNLAPDFERLAMALRMAPSVTSRITDAEARAWDAGVAGEREAYMARHPRRAPPTSAWSLMGSLKPEAVRMKLKAPKPKPPVTMKVEDAAPFLTVSAAAAATEPVAPATPPVQAAMAAIEAMKNSRKDRDAPYYPMPCPLLGHGSLEIVHTNNKVDRNDDPGNPAIWREFNRKEGQLEFPRPGKKNGEMVIYNRVDGGSSARGPRQGHLVMETYKRAQEYYRELRNKGVKTEDDSETESDNEDEKAKTKAKAKAMTRAMLRPNKGVKTEDDSETESDTEDQKAKAVLQLKMTVKLKVTLKIKRLRLRLELCFDQTKVQTRHGYIFDGGGIYVTLFGHLMTIICFLTQFVRVTTPPSDRSFIHYRNVKGQVKLRQSKNTRPTQDPTRYPLAQTMADSLSGHESVHTPMLSGHLKPNECQSGIYSITAHPPTP
uniref:Ethylene insensitive 3-like DNA-binding domain-containing protein n=1 Tax=Oryza punctata TaxID=4537 RepID=A0A0E0LJ81_ORYPU